MLPSCHLLNYLPQVRGGGPHLLHTPMLRHPPPPCVQHMYCACAARRGTLIAIAAVLSPPCGPTQTGGPSNRLDPRMTHTLRDVRQTLLPRGQEAGRPSVTLRVRTHRCAVASKHCVEAWIIGRRTAPMACTRLSSPPWVTGTVSLFPLPEGGARSGGGESTATVDRAPGARSVECPVSKQSAWDSEQAGQAQPALTRGWGSALSRARATVPIRLR